VAMAVIREYPPQSGRELVAEAVVCDDRGVVRDPDLAHGRREVIRTDHVKRLVHVGVGIRFRFQPRVAGDAEGARDMGPAAGGAWTTRAWPSDQSVSVVRQTMITASGTSRCRWLRSPRTAPDSRADTTCPAQAPSICPPTTAASWIVQTKPGGRNDEVGW